MRCPLQVHWRKLTVFEQDCFLWNGNLVIKSPRSGVTLCFQFISAASASAAAKTFPSHVKSVSDKPLIFGTKNIWVWGNVMDGGMTFPWPWPKVTAVASISKDLLTCVIKWEPFINRITTKHGSYVALVMVITWLDFGEILLKTVILANFL